MTLGDAGPALLGTAVVVVVLVILTAIREMREPGSARREWSALRQRRSLAVAAATALALGTVGWAHSGPAAVPWAVLAGLLAARILSSGSD
ncbi:hypothetical protein AB0B30_31970 [Streptomyces narbonensis]|uniref:Integral membrane protein n=1 Tax=Streptomyces narbonensis TaxID=67333 RepID=A0ABV3CGY5_9ACTN